jgi:hypothetical protein
MNLLGMPTQPQQQEGSALYIADRWPFRATICALESGQAWATLSSGGFVVYEWDPAEITPQALAELVDSQARSIFAQCAWYQSSA